MSYPLQTMFRVKTTDLLHYTAIMTANGFFEVKSPEGRKKQLYDSMENWCASLVNVLEPLDVDVTEPSDKKEDSSVTSDLIEINAPTKAELREEKRQKEKAERQAELRIKMCQPPSSRSPSRTSPWAQHIYMIMFETNPMLCKVPEIILAYNTFAEELVACEGLLITHIPYGVRRYNTGIMPQKNGLNDMDNVRLMEISRTPKNHERLTHLFDLYVILFSYISNQIIPHCNKRILEFNDLMMKKRREKRIETLHKQMKRLTDNYMKQMGRIQAELEKETKLDSNPTKE